MENLVASPEFWRERRVFLTGHTGFKGSWLAIWLRELGANVHGFSLEAPTQPSLYQEAAVADLLVSETIADLADLQSLQAAMTAAAPEIVLHLAAQSLVRPSYRDPLGTFRDNVMGTAHVLEAVRQTPSVRSVVVVTTDKVYQNREWHYPYREADHLGGHDPYSASKAAAEIVTASYRASFFHSGTHPAQIATARAGNVIGGGDWATDRLVPDCLRAFGSGQAVILRNPAAVRPWQHVVEPLSGYLLLAQALATDDGQRFADSWNFGPSTSDNVAVGTVAQAFAARWGPNAIVDCRPDPANPHEAGQLRLDSSKAQALLGWQPRWQVADAIANTVDWHRAWLAGESPLALCRRQIRAYAAEPPQS